MKTISVLLPLVVLTSLLAGCGERSSRSFTDAYLAALETHPGAPAEAAWVEDFIKAYGDFKGERLRERIREIYAPRFYFNDTLRSVEERDDLAQYLGHTAQRLESMKLTIQDRQVSGNDAYLRWTMRTQFSVGWRSTDTTTLGMTHLRFNEQGQVVLHQDFWDSRQGVFEHIPVLGGTIEWVRKRL